MKTVTMPVEAPETTVITTDLLELGILALEHDTGGQCTNALRRGTMHCIEGVFAELLVELFPDTYHWVEHFPDYHTSATGLALGKKTPWDWETAFVLFPDDWNRIHARGWAVIRRAVDKLAPDRPGMSLAALNDYSGVSFARAARALREARAEIEAEEGRR